MIERVEKGGWSLPFVVACWSVWSGLSVWFRYQLALWFALGVGLFAVQVGIVFWVGWSFVGAIVCVSGRASVWTFALNSVSALSFWSVGQAVIVPITSALVNNVR